MDFDRRRHHRRSDNEPCQDLDEFLQSIDNYPEDHLFLLKDVHLSLSNPQVIRRMRDLIPVLASRRQTILCIGPVEQIPIEWMKDVTLIEMPIPGLDEMREELTTVLEEQDPPLELDNRQEEHMAKAVLGLTAREARKAFARSLQGRQVVDDEVYAALVAEKRHMVQGSDLLEFFDLDEGISDIGGLDRPQGVAQATGRSLQLRRPGPGHLVTPRACCSSVCKAAGRV